MIYHCRVFKVSFSSDLDNSGTSCSTQGNLFKLFCNNNRYGKCSITLSVVGSLNRIQKQLKNTLLKEICPQITLKRCQ